MGYNYYESELSRLTPSSSTLQVKFNDDNTSTKWLALNEESIPIIIKYLEELYEEVMPDRSIRTTNESVNESVNEDIQLLDKITYKGQRGYVNAQLGDKVIVQIQGSTYMVDPKDLKEFYEKPKITTHPSMKFDDKTQALLFEQFVKCAIYAGNVPVRLNDCFVRYSHYKNANDNEEIKILVEGNTIFMPKNSIRIVENLNDFANPDNYVPGVLIDEASGEAVVNILVNAIDYTMAVGEADSVKIIVQTPEGEQEMQTVPRSQIKTLSV